MVNAVFSPCTVIFSPKTMPAPPDTIEITVGVDIPADEIPATARSVYLERTVFMAAQNLFFHEKVGMFVDHGGENPWSPTFCGTIDAERLNPRRSEERLNELVHEAETIIGRGFTGNCALASPIPMLSEFWQPNHSCLVQVPPVKFNPKNFSFFVLVPSAFEMFADLQYAGDDSVDVIEYTLRVHAGEVGKTWCKPMVEIQNLGFENENEMFYEAL